MKNYIVGKTVNGRIVWLGEFGWTMSLESARLFDRVGAELAIIMRGGDWYQPVNRAA